MVVPLGGGAMAPAIAEFVEQPLSSVNTRRSGGGFATIRPPAPP
jgi:hypothetical protein